MKKYDYFEKEGAVFRREIVEGRRLAPLVDDIKRSVKWKPPEGDRQAPVFFGDQITPEEAGE